MPRKPASKPEQVNVKIEAEIKPDTPFYYVNFISVNHSPYDFSISAVKLPSKLTADQIALAKAGKPVLVEPILQLVVPPAVTKALIQALSEQCRKYEDRYGKISLGDNKNGQIE